MTSPTTSQGSVRVTADSLDPDYAEPLVDVNEERSEPVPHRYVSGGFRGTDARFSFYFPPPQQYGGRFFHGIASNLPGPPALLTLTGRRVAGVYPILPLAPGAPFALGAMSWGPAYGWGLAADPALIDAAALTAGVEAVFSDPGSRPQPRLPRQRRGPNSDPDRSASPTRRARRPAADRSGC